MMRPGQPATMLFHIDIDEWAVMQGFLLGDGSFVGMKTPLPDFVRQGPMLRETVDQLIGACEDLLGMWEDGASHEEMHEAFHGVAERQGEEGTPSP